jgi:hypothetical protein
MDWVSVHKLVLELGCSACVDLTGGYCWPTLTCRNLCAQHAILEGKKAEETPSRKSTSRTLKQVGQQYPGVFQNIGDLGKLKDAVTLKRSILMAKPDIEGRDFYPLLAEVGKEILKERAWLEYAIARRFVQYCG